MSVVLKQNGTAVTSSIALGSLQLKSVLTKETSTLQFSVLNYSGKAVFVVGDQVDLYQDSYHVFGGTVVTIENVNDGGKLIESQISCIDWSFRMNTKLVTKNYAAMDPADIVADILSNFTDGTYTTTYVVRGNFAVSTIKFNYVSVTNSLEKLAKQIGWEWYVDPDKNLYFFPPNVTATAPFGLDDTSGNFNWPTLDVTEDLTNMKNSIYVLGGTYTNTFTSGNTPDTYKTNGVQQVFSLSYPYDLSTLTVTLAGVSQTIGTANVTDPATVQVLYNDSGRFIQFTTTPTTGQTVVIYGNAKIPVLTQVQNSAAVALYGEQQDVIVDSTILSVAEAQERAQAQLDLYGGPIYTVKFDTLKTGLIIGQTINVNSTIWGVDINVIVKEVDAKAYSPTSLIYSVTCVGTEIVNFIDIMKVLLLQANSSTDSQVDASTILQVLLTIAESSTVTDSVATPTKNSPPYVWGGAGGNVMVWGEFTWS